MSERLHYFTEASTPVSFDCDDSEIDSDIDDLARRPTTETDRAKQHQRQLQLWSDEARRRRSAIVQTTSSPASPIRRQSMNSMNEVSQLGLSSLPHQLSAKLQSPEMRARLSADRSTYRQQSNLSERTRSASSRVSRSPSSKNLKIRITPSSSTKSLLSDIESELGTFASHPQSPPINAKAEDPLKGADRATAPIASVSKQGEALHVSSHQKEVLSNNQTDEKANNKSVSTSDQVNDEQEQQAQTVIPRRMSFTERVKKLTSWKRLLRR